MLPLFFAGIMFGFLVLGSLVFLTFLLVPRGREYALSAALWCAVWGPCSVLLMLIAGAGLISAAFVGKRGDLLSASAPNLSSAVGWSYLVIGVVITVILATGAARVHQVLIKRLTFALFRLYATAVSAGIGSVFGWCFGWWVTMKGLGGYGWLLWAFGMLICVSAFGIAAYKGARGLRGEAPTGLTWITPEEYAGN